MFTIHLKYFCMFFFYPTFERILHVFTIRLKGFCMCFERFLFACVYHTFERFLHVFAILLKGFCRPGFLKS